MPRLGSLVRVASSGHPLKIIAERQVARRAVFVARLPQARDARYLLRIVNGKTRLSRTFTVKDPASSALAQSAPDPDPRSLVVCDHGQPVEGVLSGAPAESSPGEVVAVTLTNTGSACLRTNDVVLWQAYRDGAWVDVPLYGWTAALHIVQPGSSFSAQFTIPQDSPPGNYRLGKRIDAEGPSTEVFAEIRVIG